MPRRTQVPADLKDNLPKRAQTTYVKAYNSAWEQYSTARKRRAGASREETANKVAWSAVKKSYKKGDDGKWHRKTED